MNALCDQDEADDALEHEAVQTIQTRQPTQVIRNMHDSVMTGLEGIQENTANVLQEQERDLMRSFRARIQDLTKELENQRAARVCCAFSFRSETFALVQ